MKRRRWLKTVDRVGKKRHVPFAGLERLEERSLMAVAALPIVPGSMTPVVVNSHVADKIGYDLAWMSADYQLTHPAATQGASASSFQMAQDQPNARLLNVQNGSVV